jgi:ribosomal protein S18 acetylase RimI-like enzyme
MDPHSIVIRAANPTYSEGIACGRYLNEASEGFFRFMLGGRFLHIIAKAYKRSGHSYSHQNVSFVEHDERIVGMALGFTAEQYHRFSEKPLREAAGCHAVRMTAVKLLFSPMLRILETIPDGDFYLLAMAVDKELRGEGIGSALMDSVEKRACASGSVRLSLDVSANNTHARRLYERRGMIVSSQWPKRLPLPGLRFYRMTKAL